MSVDVETAVRWYRKTCPGGTVEAAIRAYENSLRTSREAKRRRRGRCVDCGTETHYSGRNDGGVSLRCPRCAPSNGKVWTREAIIEAMRAYAAKYGLQPSARDWNPLMAIHDYRDDLAERFYEDACWPSATTVQATFGSWNAAIIAAGFTPLRPGHKHSDGPPYPGAA